MRDAQFSRTFDDARSDLRFGFCEFANYDLESELCREAARLTGVGDDARITGHRTE